MKRSESGFWSHRLCADAHDKTLHWLVRPYSGSMPDGLTTRLGHYEEDIATSNSSPADVVSMHEPPLAAQ